ncbi:amidase family protein [Seohaeicola zhoushanensis]|uniref:Amidase n=1 Tax=Seohaeicola zhoushanensis TaxID=1569283 RepID=A0A8J3GZE0_9RHOB|nr:amidase family protein [Seohaeicola zhoushanensis]GHF56491.1 amidase [Seohaeicola zhoushanensis]
MGEIWKMQAGEIASAVRSRILSAEEVTRAHLDRIAAANPQLNAVVQEFPEEAMKSARALDARIAKGEDVGPLAGVPVTIKVNVDQAGHATTNGLVLQKDHVASADTPVVANLRKAGAVIVGRTNTPAFSMRWFTNNSLHGMTLNPRNTALTPGGSSGGAGSAVAAGFCAIGHGTDIAGSVRYPAYACGLHGLRPTLGRIPAWNSSLPDRYIGAQLMAVSGPLGRSISDIALSFEAMAAGDYRDPWWVPVPLRLGEFPKRAALCVRPDGLSVAPEVEAALRQAAAALTEAGWQVEEVDCPPLRPAAAINAQLWMAESRAVAQAIARENDPDANFVFARMTADSPEMDMPALMTALQQRVGMMREWSAFLARYPVLICPVSGELPFAQQQDVSSEAAFDAIMEAQLTQRALPVLGVPALAVATGMTSGAPVGVQLVAERFREDVLLAAGAAIEAACGVPQVEEL